MLSHNPERMDAKELADWLRHLVEDSIEEGVTLDYKQQIDIGSPNENREIAKDVSALANTIGGTLIYGIAETKIDGANVPAASGHGIEIAPGTADRINNILADSVKPRILEIGINEVEFEGGSVLLLWTPRSTLPPHMVSGYSEARFYTRSGTSSRPMQEHQVEESYRERAAFARRTEEFLTSAAASRPLASAPNPERFWAATYAIVPLVDLGMDRNLAVPGFQPYGGGQPLQWRSTPTGVESKLAWTVRELEQFAWPIAWPEDYYAIHSSGAVVMWEEGDFGKSEVGDDRWDWHAADEALRLRNFLRLATILFESQNYVGPVRLVVRPSVLGDADDLQRIEVQIQSPAPFRDATPLLCSSELWRADINTTAGVITSRPSQVITSVMNELLRYFGLPEMPGWFRQSLEHAKAIETES